MWAYRERSSTGELWLPRGAWDHLPSSLKLRDKRSFPKLPKLDTNIVLDYSDDERSFHGQRVCVDSMFNSKFQQGLVKRAPGTGKSQIALYFAAQVGTRSLIIVHTEDLLNQWIDYAQKSIPGIDIGVIRQSEDTVGHVTFAMLQTLYRRNFPPEWWRQFGVTIVDECHHAPAKSFDHVLSQSTSRYRFGFSASETRADGMEPLMRFAFGGYIHSQEFASPVPVTVEKVKTEFRANVNMTGPVWRRRKVWQQMITKLSADKKRNTLIARRVEARLAEGRSVLVLSRRIEHLQNIQEELNADSVVLAAKLVPKKTRRELVSQFRSGKIKCVLATQLADEGLDIPRLSCIVLAYPGKHTDLIMQQVGRALREHEAKADAIVIDMVDENVKLLRSQWHSRRRAYLSWGFKISGASFIEKLGSAKRIGRKFRPVVGRSR